MGAHGRNHRVLRKRVLGCTWDRVWLTVGDLGETSRKHGSTLNVVQQESRVNSITTILRNIYLEGETWESYSCSW
jgi:hypothetical protein